MFHLDFHIPWKDVAISGMDFLAPSFSVQRTAHQEMTKTQISPVNYTTTVWLPKLNFQTSCSTFAKCGDLSPPPKETNQEDNRYFLKSHCLQCNIGTCSRSDQSIPCTSLFPGTSYLTLPADKSCKMHIPLKAGFQHSKPKEIPSQQLPHPPDAQNK